ncbi:MAG TPA: hypothetical protein VGQ26_24940 [Streptosporangiaceae bacterium]|nr:hypothetical protein [Streptosporangiaceae bacterium]
MVIAAETRATLDLNHDFMLKQMVGTKLDVAAFLAPRPKEPASRCPPARRWPGERADRVSRLGPFDMATAADREQFRR